MRMNQIAVRFCVVSQPFFLVKMHFEKYLLIAMKFKFKSTVQ